MDSLCLDSNRHAKKSLNGRCCLVSYAAGMDPSECGAQSRKRKRGGQAVKKKKNGMTSKLTKLELISCPEVVVLVVFV